MNLQGLKGLLQFPGETLRKAGEAPCSDVFNWFMKYYLEDVVYMEMALLNMANVVRLSWAVSS